jgi:gamma-glutamylcyclotransferase (GGCT)/AIG2-like uncharacterized protein YtfP
MKCSALVTTNAVLTKSKRRIKVTLPCAKHARADALTCISHKGQEETYRSMLNAFTFYGTLKRGHGNHRLMDGAIESIEPCTVDNYTLFGDGIPYARPAPGLYVSGELVRIEPSKLPGVLERLDRLEGHPHHYIRTLVRVRVRSGELQPAWMYVAVSATWSTNHIGAVWPPENEEEPEPETPEMTKLADDEPAETVYDDDDCFDLAEYRRKQALEP